MEQKNIDEIILSKVAGQVLTPDELAQFDQWYAEEANRLHYEALLRVRSGVIASGAAGIDCDKAWKKVSPPAPKLSAGKRALRYAAILALPLLAGTAYLIHQGRQAPAVAEEVVVKPGNALAVLLSPSGQRLVFSETEETRIENGSGTINIKGLGSADNGPGIVCDSIVQMAGITPGDKEATRLTLETPRGGYICYALPDGSKVWLNSESRLHFPAAFPKGRREVELEGEAYFLVGKGDGRPFIVRTGDYDVRVTGTEFNVRSYDHGTTATTLVRGGVQVEMNGTVSKLTPGCQATITNGGIETRKVNVERYVAWQQGAFAYAQTPLGEIMDDLMRWYDIEVVWEDKNARNYHFSAWFDRQSEIGEIIDVLRKTNRVELTLKGRTLTINDK